MWLKHTALRQTAPSLITQHDTPVRENEGRDGHQLCSLLPLQPPRPPQP